MSETIFEYRKPGPGRRYWIAEFGGFRESAKTKEEVTEKLKNTLLKVLEYDLPKIFQYKQCVAVILKEFDGYTYRLWDTINQKPAGNCMLNTKEEAERKARLHIAQYLEDEEVITHSEDLKFFRSWLKEIQKLAEEAK